MENTNVSNEQKFTKLEITPKPSVRVYHTPNAGRDYYTLSYYDEEGRRQRRLFPDQQSAEAEAEKLAKKLEKRELPGLMLNGRERLIYERALEAVRADSPGVGGQSSRKEGMKKDGTFGARAPTLVG
jgi:hypothetical protein